MEVQIKGRKSGTLAGYIELCDKGRGDYEFKHCTRPAAKHWSQDSQMKKMHRWGWKADMEIEKTTLFTCRSRGRSGVIEWQHKDELTDEIVTVASEEDNELNMQKQVSDKIRDALVTCWIVKHWSMGVSKRPADVQLSRRITVG